MVLLSHRAWANHFGSDPDIIGATVGSVGAKAEWLSYPTIPPQ